MRTLFNTNQSSSTLIQFRKVIDGLVPENEFETGRNNLIRLVVNSMESKSEEWDSMCQINIEWVGDHFMGRLSENDGELSKERLDDICALCFRFLFELYLSIKNDLSIDFERARRFVFENIQLFESHAKEQIEYAIREMPISIFKHITNSEEISSIKTLSSTVEHASKLKTEWDKELREKETRVNNLKESLIKYENAYNFVGLFEGFDELGRTKEKEQKKIFWGLLLLALLIICPIITQLIVIYAHLENISVIKEGLIVSIFPTVSLVAIAVYYFRVLLFNFKSVKSQLLQIDLRKTLCRFIQHYASYSSEIKNKDSESLAKFENIVFSGIVTDEGNLPSTYDGLELW